MWQEHEQASHRQRDWNEVDGDFTVLTKMQLTVWNKQRRKHWQNQTKMRPDPIYLTNCSRLLSPTSPFSHAHTRTHHQPDSSPPGLIQWACYKKASAYGSRVGWTRARRKNSCNSESETVRRWSEGDTRRRMVPRRGEHRHS